MSAPYSGYANGKLLITGEYLVMYGALSLAVPLTVGQSIRVGRGAEPGILHWEAGDPSGTWFTARIKLPDLEIIASSDEKAAAWLTALLKATRTLNRSFLSDADGIQVITTLDFDRYWGLGSSSTLIALIARMANVDAFSLHRAVSDGSGYDVACALHDKPVLFRLNNGIPDIRQVSFTPSFTDQLYLIYLGRKQDSSREVYEFRKKKASGFQKETDEVTSLSDKIVRCNNFEEFSTLIDRHEQIMSSVLGQVTIKEQLFQDFQGSIKSLGAWGGDFIMAATASGYEYVKRYFAAKGLEVVFPFRSLVKSTDLTPGK
ncbi:MAG: GYDIA family GHMP kinase [Lentimicrobium sp.]|uniref:GYDIA family GHMP kinase n=1 Tax=Lentimicrobium sp. TaxID=2034841 RepID=UPI0025F23F0B|nr:GYDIA family GHMP kinase [Lentimicrobium sp.]MCO5255853.1 GYDIA family GHMP kinase [Lentimicrobium sp.]